MTKKEAVEILKNHNKWRKGEDVQPYSPSVLSEAIDTVTEAIVSNQSHTADVTDEEISEAAKLCIKDTEGDIIVDDMIDKVFYFNSGAKWALSRMPDNGLPIKLKKSEKLEKGDVFLWRSAMSGRFEIHTFHSDSGYVAKTFTRYNEKDGSSDIVNYSGICGVLVCDEPAPLPKSPTT
jgi:hypothetical protein